MTALRPVTALSLALALCLGFTGEARAWELFRSENDHVEEGNEALAKGDAQAALEAYEAASRELPDRGDVQLNRGLALSQLGRYEEARQAFEQATRSKSEPSTRADAYYNLGRTFLEGASQQADGGNLQGAQGQLREARDALRQSLRQRPGFRDAAWNLELAQRRLVEIEEKLEQQRQQEQQEQAQQEQQEQREQQEQGEDGSESQDGQPSDDESSPEGDTQPQDGDEPSPDAPGEPDEQKPQDEQEAGQEPEGQDPSEQPETGDDQREQPAKPEPSDGKQTPTPQEPAQASQQPSAPGEALPQHMQQVLDALQDGEETMQRHQARTRAQRRPRRVEKDW